MDLHHFPIFHLHHINYTIILTTTILILTLSLYLLRNILFCARFCNFVLKVCRYELPSQQSEELKLQKLKRNNQAPTHNSYSDDIEGQVFGDSTNIPQTTFCNTVYQHRGICNNCSSTLVPLCGPGHRITAHNPTVHTLGSDTQQSGQPPVEKINQVV